jgi:RNA polymerase sigma factor (TIGR02999 family)
LRWLDIDRLADAIITLYSRSAPHPQTVDKGPGIMGDVTRILEVIDAGGAHATEDLLPLVYDELRQLAARKLAREKPGQTLQATALVHEVYIRLVNAKRSHHWNGRAHFFAAAAEAMRRILIDQARHKRTQKAGGLRAELDVLELEDPVAGAQVDLLALDEALEKLEAKDKRKAELVKLRFFAGLTNAQAADVLGVSTSTADNDWAYAKTWLRVEISK